MEGYVYALLDPDTDAVRYIGRSLNPVQRLRAHLSYASRSKMPVSRWIMELRARGRKPDLELLECLPEEGLDAGEIAWIATASACCEGLTNRTEGGPGSHGYVQSLEARLKVGAWNKGRKRSPEHIAKAAATHVGKKRSAETRARISAAAKRRDPSTRIHSAETKAKISAAHTGQHHSPETRAKMAEGVRRWRASKSQPASSQLPLPSLHGTD